MTATNTWIEALTHHAQHRGEKLAFAYIDDKGKVVDHLNFGQLLQQASKLAGHIQSYCSVGERVLLLYPPGLDYVRAFYACMLAGVVAVPLYSPHNRRKLELIQNIAKDCSPSLALTTAKYAERGATASSEFKTLRWLSTDNIGQLSSHTWLSPELQPDDLAYLQYTSGSTSSPKGVMLSHRVTLNHCTELQQLWDTHTDSVLVSWLPHFHDLGQVFSVLQPVFQGMSSILMSPAVFMQTPHVWLQAITDFGATHSAAPDFAYMHCAQNVSNDNLSTLDLRHWEVAVNGAEPVRNKSILAFHQRFSDYGASLQMHRPSYGLAEATLVVTAHSSSLGPRTVWFDGEKLSRNIVQCCSHENPKALALVSNGYSVPGVAIAVVDPETCQSLGEDMLGEVWVSGGSIGLGYWGKPDEYQPCFAALTRSPTDGRKYLRTGDLGFFHGGELFIAGRAKDLIIIRGSNHYPQDIELTVECCHPLIRGGYTAAFSVTEDGEELLIIAAERKRHFPSDIDYESVLQQIRSAVVSKHGVSANEILILKPGSISKTTSGKIQRKMCRDQWKNSTLKVLASYKQAQSHLAPASVVSEKSLDKEPVNQATSIQQVVQASVLNRVIDWLCKEHCHERTNIQSMKALASYGVSSMDTFRLHDDLEHFLQCDIRAEYLWEAETIHQLANDIANDYLLGIKGQTDCHDPQPNAPLTMESSQL